MKKVLCFGDSNTWGYNPVDGSHYKNPWPVLLSKKLSGITVLTEGMPGRTTRLDGASGERINGFQNFAPLFEQESPDHVIVALGTNDLQTRFNCSADEIADSLRIYVEYIGSENVTLIIPAQIHEIGYFGSLFAGAARKSLELPKAINALAEDMNCYIIDANSCINPSPVDGIHWSETDHENFADLLLPHLKRIL